MSRSFRYVCAALVLAAGAAALGVLHLENRRLQRAVLADAARAGETARLRQESAQLERLLTEHRAGAETGRASLEREIAAARAEIAALERKAAEQQAARAAATARDSVALESNRNPRQGLMRLEHFQNRGQATPSAAFATLVWSALSGDDATLAEVTTLNSATRAKAEAFIATLPADDRATWTPEKLGRLWFTGLFTEMPGLQIVGEQLVAADEAVLRLRLAGRSDEEKLALRLTPQGWKILVPGAAIDQLRKKLQPRG